VCIVPDADVGTGYLRVHRWDDGGFDVHLARSTPSPEETPRLLVDAHVGMGVLQIVHDPFDTEWYRDGWDHEPGWRELGEPDDPRFAGSDACVAA
jgi:hypothetical protein